MLCSWRLVYTFAVADIVRRSHARVPCDVPVRVLRGAAAGSLLGDGRLLDVSPAGGYLRFAGELERGSPYRLRAETDKGAVDLPFRVARIGPRGSAQHPGIRHYGIVFNLTAGQERALSHWVDWLRRHPPTVPETRLERSIRSYWEL
jgi:hypothetical protein